jgi:hypothetical protein
MLYIRFGTSKVDSVEIIIISEIIKIAKINSRGFLDLIKLVFKFFKILINNFSLLNPIENGFLELI